MYKLCARIAMGIINCAFTKRDNEENINKMNVLADDMIIAD